MSEENRKPPYSVGINANIVKLDVKFEELHEILEKEEELFKVSKSLYGINSVFSLREKYSDLYHLLPKELIIFHNEDKWVVWEKVLLILFSNHTFPTNRSEIWDFKIGKSTLRGIIRDKSEHIEAIDDDKLKLTEEGLKYILKKLNDELFSYRNMLREGISNE